MHPVNAGEPDAIEVTLLMPCLDEAQTIATCVRKGFESLQREGIRGEVLVADNGSTDGSPDIATRCGARVVAVHERGYGAALRHGIQRARGRFVIMADADDSYDWRDIAPFVQRLREGYDFVMGCRLPQGGGRIMPGAMPRLNRYVGNPVLSGIGRALFRCPITDFHCGMRGFDREKVLALDLKTPGMEFATEMVIRATQARLKIVEVPITLHRDGRSRPPHLRPWRDGWRHLRFMLLYSPNWLFWLPGLVLLGLGLLGFALILPGPLRIAHINLDANTLLFSALACIVGHQWISFALAAHALGERDGLLAPDRSLRRLQAIFSLERGIGVGLLLMCAGLFLLGVSLRYWASLQFGDIPYATGLRIVIPSVTLLALGAQFIMSSFFFSLTLLKPYASAGRSAEGAVESPSAEARPPLV